jgi:pimeloyl-ACP methyl ester carboxylesterase
MVSLKLDGMLDQRISQPYCHIIRRGVLGRVPALYIAGDRDPVVKFPGIDRHIADLPKLVPQLRGTIMVPGCGHITQEERPAEVNAAMIEFIRRLS